MRTLHRTTARPAPRIVAVAALAATVLLLGACAGPAEDDAADPAPTESPTTPAPSDDASSGAPSDASSEPAPAGPTLEVTVAGDQVGPNVEEIALAVDEPLTITFEADRAGELHVHSNPEQYVEFTQGRSEQTLTVGTPGTVEVEEHESGAVVAVLTVA